MQRVIVCVTVFATIVLGASVCLFVSNTTSLSYTDCLRTTFVRDAAPSWTTVQFDGFSVDVPYSAEWDIEHGGCRWSGGTYVKAIYSVVIQNDENGEVRQALAFGRPADNVSGSESEYHLSRRGTGVLPFAPSGSSCGRTDTAPVMVTVGSATGWQYFDGGAKWCEMVFDFDKDGTGYALTRNMEPTGTFTMDDEIRRIVESVKD